jgi:hypothetical protein
MDEHEDLTGTVEGAAITLTGEHVRRSALPFPRGAPQEPAQPVRYDLRWDAGSGHLVGARNGQAFWAARPGPQEPSNPARCGPPPP